MQKKWTLLYVLIVVALLCVIGLCVPYPTLSRNSTMGMVVQYTTIVLTIICIPLYYKYRRLWLVCIPLFGSICAYFLLAQYSSMLWMTGIALIMLCIP